VPVLALSISFSKIIKSARSHRLVVYPLLVRGSAVRAPGEPRYAVNDHHAGRYVRNVSRAMVAMTGTRLVPRLVQVGGSIGSR